jgi:signal peptidase I
LDGLDIDLRREDPAAPPRPPGGGEPVPGVLGKIWEVIMGWAPPMLAVLIIRSILVEPFQIPSGSMVPTLAIGDYILVSKLSYGLRVPFTNMEILPLGEPERGEVIVFLYPPDLARGVKTDYVKRIVGLPGDTVEVREDVVYVNGVAQARTETGAMSYRDAPKEGCIERTMRQYEEDLGGVKHPILQTTEFAGQVADFPPEKVPAGHYFVLGDNRDKSADSRFWKFVPRENVRGKAKWVWLSFDGCAGGSFMGAPRLERIGESIR